VVSFARYVPNYIVRGWGGGVEQETFQPGSFLLWVWASLAHTLAHTFCHMIMKEACDTGAHRGEKGAHSFRAVGGREAWLGGVARARMGGMETCCVPCQPALCRVGI
jgi:hypothetical protein